MEIYEYGAGGNLSLHQGCLLLWFILFVRHWKDLQESIKRDQLIHFYLTKYLLTVMVDK